MALVSLEPVDGVGVVRMLRPEKLNALNLEMWRSLRGLVERACRGFEGVVITGSGRAFSAGDDIAAMLSLEDRAGIDEFFGEVSLAIESIALCRRPVVAAVNGIAAGGGAEILLVVDGVVAVRGAWISFPEALIGLLPPILLTLGSGLLGPRKAKYLALTGERIPVEEAQRMGLVDLVVAPGDLIQASILMVKAMSGAPETAVAAIKRIAYEEYRARLNAALEALKGLLETPEARERMRGFLEARGRRAAGRG